MKVIGVAMAKNEGDVIEAFVRRNLRFLDHLVVIDHDSTDATGEILFRLRGEGLPLSVGVDHSLAFEQGERMTAAVRQALRQFDADACVALDADEFLLADPRAAIATIPPGHVGQLRWALYLDEQRRVVDDRITQSKCVVTREFAANDWVISAGNHWVVDPAGPTLVPNVDLPLELAHLPFRSTAQVTQKVLLGHFAHRLAYGGRDDMAHVNWHWRHVYERIMGDGLRDADLATLAVQSYAGGKPFEHAAETKPPATEVDPLPAVELRYGELARVDPVRSLARWTEKLLAAAGR